MSEPKSLKEQNAWLIRAAMIAHIVGFAWITLEPAKIVKGSLSDFLLTLEAVTVPGSMSLGLIVIASLVLLGLIPPNWRDRIIHLRWHNPLPGCRAFTSIGPAASHVDMNCLSARLGQLPSDPAEQNKLFYKIYKPLRDDVGVCDPHRRYLAARDIGTITALLVVPLSLLAFVATENAGRSLVYGVALLVTYLFCAMAAKNYSLRMAQHVLALSAAQPEISGVL